TRYKSQDFQKMNGKNFFLILTPRKNIISAMEHRCGLQQCFAAIRKRFLRRSVFFLVSRDLLLFIMEMKLAWKICLSQTEKKTQEKLPADHSTGRKKNCKNPIPILY